MHCGNLKHSLCTPIVAHLSWVKSSVMYNFMSELDTSFELFASENHTVLFKAGFAEFVDKKLSIVTSAVKYFYREIQLFRKQRAYYE